MSASATVPPNDLSEFVVEGLPLPQRFHEPGTQAAPAAGVGAGVVVGGAAVQTGGATADHDTPIWDDWVVNRTHDVEHDVSHSWVYDSATDAAASGLPIEMALQAVRDGYAAPGAPQDAVTEAVRVWRKCRNGFDSKHERVVSLIGRDWPELFEALDRLHRERD